jgi:hypothetical protein
MLRTSCCLVLLLVTASATTALAKPPSWDVRNDKAGRFKVLKAFANAAVLDTETGLVWERTPGNVQTIFVSAASRCLNNEIGARFGWRLPTDYELTTLLVTSPTTFLRGLPEGTPFIGVQPPVAFWTSSLAPDRTDVYDLVEFGFAANPVAFTPPNNTALSWCVRGGLGP